MAVSEVDQTQAERPFVFFLFKGITGIYEAWDEGSYEVALRRALRLTVFLPSDIKEALKEDKEEVLRELNKAYRISGVDFFTTHQVRNRAARRVSVYYLEPYVDEMIRLLDEKQWLERGALRPQFKQERRLRT